MTFETGAIRSVRDHKLDFEACLSHSVLVRYAEFMREHRHLPDGKVRESDNWQRGMPIETYMGSAFRHFMDWWGMHRSRYPVSRNEIENSICAVMFNAMGYLHEYMKDRCLVNSCCDSAEDKPEPEPELEQTGSAIAKRLRHIADQFEFDLKCESSKSPAQERRPED